MSLPDLVRLAIVAHADVAAPHECCGLLVGRGRRVLAAIPMPNVAATPLTRFEVDPASHIWLRRTLRATRPSAAIVGVYHSHPAGEPVPSPRDVADAHYDEWVHIVVGRPGASDRIQAFRILHGQVRPVKIRAT